MPVRRPPLVVVMGVSGSGKSTLGSALATALGVEFQEGDDLHSPAAVEHMRRGLPLDDAARAPWLARIAAWLDQRIEHDEGGVISCSGLRRAARDSLRRPSVHRVYLAVPKRVLHERVLVRSHAFMPASLLDSQLEALEPIGDDESVLRIDGEGDTATVVRRVLDALSARAREPLNSW